MIDIREQCPIKCLAHDNKDYTCNRLNCLKYRAFQQGKAEAFAEVLDRIDEGVCGECGHDSPNCHERCWCENWNMETLFQWVAKKKEEYNDR